MSVMPVDELDYSRELPRHTRRRVYATEATACRLPYAMRSMAAGTNPARRV